MRNAFKLAVALALFAFGGGLAPGGPPESKDVAKVPFHAQGEKSGDPTQTSIILLTRLTAVEQSIAFQLPADQWTRRRSSSSMMLEIASSTALIIAAITRRSQGRSAKRSIYFWGACIG